MIRRGVWDVTLGIILALLGGQAFAQHATVPSRGGVSTASAIGSALYCEDAGGDDTYVCTLTPTITTLDKLTITMKVTTGNTGAATVNVNGLGAKAIKKAQGGVTTDPADNDIRADAVIVLSYDGTNFQIQSTLGNAGAGTGDALVANPLSQFAATTSAQFAGVISDETGTGAVVLADSPTLVTPALGTPSALVATNATGTAAGLTAGNVTTNANLTGPITSVGNATTVAEAELAALAGLTSAADKGIQFTGAGTAGVYDLTAAAKTVLDDATVAAMVDTLGGASSSGTGGLVRANTPTLVTPVIGAATGTSIDLTGAATIEGGVNYCLDAVGTDSYACSLSPAITAYSTGTVYAFKAGAANTGAATLNLNAIGAQAIVKTAGGVTTVLADNDIRSGSVVQVAWDGTNFQLVSPVANATSSTITSGTTATSGCVAGGVLRSISNLVECGAGLTYASSIFTVGTGASSTARKMEVANGSAASLALVLTHSSATTAFGSIGLVDIPLAIQNTSSTDNNFSFLSFSNAAGAASSGILGRSLSQSGQTGALEFYTRGADGLNKRLELSGGTATFNNSTNAVSPLAVQDNGTLKWSIRDGGHPTYSTTIPAVSNTSANSCGTDAATIAGTSERGIITVGATSGTSCTITFPTAAPTRRVCVINNETTANLARATYSSPTVTFFAGTFVGGDVIAYVCDVY